MKLDELLQKGKKELIKNNIEDPFLIARILLKITLEMNQNEIVINKDNIVKKEEQEKYEQLIEKIVEGTPIQYITNNQEFMKLQFYVNENVLIPQPDTETLIEEILNIEQQKKQEKQKIKKNNEKNNEKEILDICTGSGCIGISLAYYLENVKVTLSDISKKALEIATTNAKNNKVLEKIKIIQSDMFENIEGKFDIIVSNPPYIETNTITTLSKQVQNEPLLALDGGDDGLKFYEILLKTAPKYLKENGYLCMEIGYNQKQQIVEIAEKVGAYQKIETKKDLSGNDRIVKCLFGDVY